MATSRGHMPGANSPVRRPLRAKTAPSSSAARAKRKTSSRLAGAVAQVTRVPDRPMSRYEVATIA